MANRHIPLFRMKALCVTRTSFLAIAFRRMIKVTENSILRRCACQKSQKNTYIKAFFPLTPVIPIPRSFNFSEDRQMAFGELLCAGGLPASLFQSKQR